jgi:hypothetical protein
MGLAHSSPRRLARRYELDRPMVVSRPDAGPFEPSTPVPDPFELLRRSDDLVVDIQGTGDHAFCQFDEATGWPKHNTLKGGTGPSPDGFCKIDETAERGISLRQLLATYEHVKLRCKMEEWTGRDGKPLTPETVTLYDMNKYVIKPSTEARRHECSFVENGQHRRVRMVRTKVREGEEIACTQCAAKLTNWVSRSDRYYWQCHPLCDDKHKLCGACACCSFVELVTGVGEKPESVRRCPDGHAPMARTRVHADSTTDAAEKISCTQCANKLEKGATYWVCHHCGDKHELCGACAPAPVPVPRAELQRPLCDAVIVAHFCAG